MRRVGENPRRLPQHARHGSEGRRLLGEGRPGERAGSSGVSRVAKPDIIAYAATKGALDVFTLSLAKELGPRGITVNSVAPGIVDTDLNAGWLRGNEQAAQAAASVSALGRIGRPDDIAAVVAFLAGEDGRWVSGRVVDATGGSGL